jgi:quercetin dioxygenase-like cupin family protein
VNSSYLLLENLAGQVETPRDGTLSRTLYNDDRLKAVLFAFSAGQELSEHTSSMPAVLHFLSGEAEVTLGDDRVAAKRDTWIHMPAGLRHAIKTREPTTMLLLLLKNPAASA